MIGVEKTLIISCGESGLNKSIEFDDRIFIYTPADGTLHHHDHREKERIQYYVESKECKQIIFASSIEQNLIDRILHEDSLRSIRKALKFNLKVFLRDQDKEIMPTSIRNQLLVELHVIAQCSHLMDYYFIRGPVQRKQLQIRGVVSTLQEGQFKPVFHNGIIYNDIISMN